MLNCASKFWSKRHDLAQWTRRPLEFAKSAVRGANSLLSKEKRLLLFEKESKIKNDRVIPLGTEHVYSHYTPILSSLLNWGFMVGWCDGAG